MKIGEILKETNPHGQYIIEVEKGDARYIYTDKEDAIQDFGDYDIDPDFYAVNISLIPDAEYDQPQYRVTLHAKAE